MTLAVRQACTQIFAGSNIVRIFALPFAQNTASRRVLEKAGFTMEGIMRKNTYKNGHFLDTTMYALVQE